MSASFKDLRFWQDAMRFVVEVYRLTSQFPRLELYGFSRQLRRATVSVPSNIAGGKDIAPIASWEFPFAVRASLLEVQTQLMIAKELQYTCSEDAHCIWASADAIGRSLNGLINALREKAV
jgi:four helix bundle protein